MPFLNSLFTCNSVDNEEKQNESNLQIVRDIAEGKTERIFMKEQLSDLRDKVDDFSSKAIRIFGVEKDIAVLNSNIDHIKLDMISIKEEMKEIKLLMMKNMNR
jgi:hypothetical protein